MEPDTRFNEALDNFSKENQVKTKGPLSVVLVITRNATEYTMPLNREWFVTENEGQVKGLGKSAVMTILRDHGINKILAEEGGRTSRGSLGLMTKYIDFLNKNVTDVGQLKFVEKYWISKVEEFFQGKPIKGNIERNKTITSFVRNLIEQAEKKQKENKGTTYVGALYQHLVGAKLRLVLKDDFIACHGYSVADDPSDRSGDFLINDTVVHVTTVPQEALIRKCIRNIEASFKPIIVTSKKGIAICDSLLEIAGIEEKVDVYELAQFISINMNELGAFSADRIKLSITEFVSKYNEIIDSEETDPSLKIQL